MAKSRVMRGRRGAMNVFALVAVITGAVILLIAYRGQDTAAEVPVDGRGSLRTAPPAGSQRASDPSPEGPAKTSSGAASQREPGPLGPSMPVSIEIPAIGVSSAVFPLGKTPDGSLAVPQPGPNLDKVAWYRNSPTPGQPGPSVIEGHVDTEQGPSVFFKLADIRPGNKIQIQRQEGSQAVFRVTAVRSFPKSQFPTALVYGGADLGTPSLRVITCSNFDPDIGTHTGNTIVFAQLDSVRDRPR